MVYFDIKGGVVMITGGTRIMSILEAIREFGTITQASKHLFITQPAISRTIKNEEQKLKVKLVDRSVRPIRLTYAGEEYLQGLETIANASSHLSDKMNEIAQSKAGMLSIALPEALGALLLPKLVQLYSEECPQYHLNIREMASVQASKATIDNQIDLYIGPKPLEKGHFIYRKIKTLHFNLLMPKITPSLHFRRITAIHQLKLLESQNYLGIDKSMITGNFLEDFFTNNNLAIKPWLQLKNFETILKLVETGLGFTILPDDYQPSSQVSIIPIDPTLLNIELIIAHRASKTNSPEMIAFLNIMKPLFGIDPELQSVENDQ